MSKLKCLSRWLAHRTSNPRIQQLEAPEVDRRSFLRTLTSAAAALGAGILVLPQRAFGSTYKCCNLWLTYTTPPCSCPAGWHDLGAHPCTDIMSWMCCDTTVSKWLGCAECYGTSTSN